MKGTKEKSIWVSRFYESYAKNDPWNHRNYFQMYIENSTVDDSHAFDLKCEFEFDGIDGWRYDCISIWMEFKDDEG